MAEPVKEVQLHRVERPEPAHLQEESGDLWAVSYADLLMVLLSFFVLFFSLEKDKKGEVVNTFTRFRAPTSVEKEIKKDFSQSGWESEPSQITQPSLSELKQSLKDFPVQVEQTASTLSFEMPEGIFAPGSTKMAGNGLKVLDDTLNHLKKYQKYIRISFIGHTDSSPITKAKSKIRFKDNLDLSVLRATDALRHAEKKGFHHSQLVAKGAGSYGRSVRSLSIEIELQGQNP